MSLLGGKLNLINSCLKCGNYRNNIVDMFKSMRNTPIYFMSCGPIEDKKIVTLCNHNMSHVMRNPDFCLCENKGADQLRRHCEADQLLCFRYSDSTIPLLLKFKISSLYLDRFCDFTGRFVSDLYKNQIVGFPTKRFLCISCHVVQLRIKRL